MLEIFNYWQINVSLAIISWVIYQQSYRIVSRDSKDVANVPIILGIVGSVVFLLLAPFFQIKFSDNLWIYFMLGLAIIFYAINDRLRSIGLKYLDVSVNSVFSQLSKVFLAIYGFLFFGEILNMQNIIGVLLIVGGSMLVYFKRGAFRINKYTWAVIGAALAFATSVAIDVDISREFNIVFYLFIIYFFPALVIYLVEKKNWEDIKNEFFASRKSIKFFILSGISSSSGMLFFLLALGQG